MGLCSPYWLFDRRHLHTLASEKNVSLQKWLTSEYSRTPATLSCPQNELPSLLTSRRWASMQVWPSMLWVSQYPGFFVCGYRKFVLHVAVVLAMILKWREEVSSCPSAPQFSPPQFLFVPLFDGHLGCFHILAVGNTCEHGGACIFPS